LTTATPFSRLTSTESTPETDFNDTRTACAQTAQSMPKILMSIDLISAEAETASTKSVASNAASLFISLLVVFMLEKQITEVDREANMLLGERRPDVLIDRELSTET
jgi:hypothetical protein